MNKLYIARQNGKTTPFINAITEVLSMPTVCTKQYESNRILQISEKYGIPVSVLISLVI